MNLRLDSEGLRFRLTLDEIGALENGRELRESSVVNFGVRFQPASERLTLTQTPDGFWLVVGASHLELLKKASSKKDAALEERFRLDDGREVNLSLEVDAFSLRPRREPRASAPAPNAGS